MKSLNEEIEIHTGEKQEIVNITPRLKDIVTRSGVREGLALVYPLHTSSAVFISDSDFSLTEDFKDLAAKLVPADAGYRHDETDYKKTPMRTLRQYSPAITLFCPSAADNYTWARIRRFTTRNSTEAARKKSW